jgi:hypothetical protein
MAKGFGPFLAEIRDQQLADHRGPSSPALQRTRDPRHLFSQRSEATPDPMVLEN